MNRVLFGDCRESMRELIEQGVKVQCVVTSPPYFGLRRYLPQGHADAALEIGSEETPDLYISHLVDVFSLVRELLADDGTCWINCGDSYASGGRSTYRSGASQNKGHEILNDLPRPTDAPGIKPKDLLGIPWMLAFALRDDGWFLRQDIIWAKPNPMPESMTDRCTKSHEYIFLLSKNERYYWDAEAMRERAVAADIGAMDGGAQRQVDGTDANGGRNFRSKRDSFKREGSKRAQAIPFQTAGTHRAQREESDFDTFTRNRRSVWTVATMPYSGAHFATFPPALVEPCVLAGSRSGDIVLDPFFGSGTTGQVAQKLGRRWIGCELQREYEALQRERTSQLGMEL